MKVFEKEWLRVSLVGFDEACSKLREVIQSDYCEQSLKDQHEALKAVGKAIDGVRYIQGAIAFIMREEQRQIEQLIARRGDRDR